MEEENSSIECAICLQPILYPVKLPCGHEFCFLCIKGLREASTIKKCAMCRANFSLQQIEQTLQLRKDSTEFKWFYEARNDSAWWAFDENSSDFIEKAFVDSKDNITITIAGYQYVIDFVKMQQYRQDTPSRIRKIKRQEDKSSGFKIKGIAGLRVAPTSSSSGAANTSNEPTDLTCDETDELSRTLSDIVLVDDQDTN